MVAAVLDCSLVTPLHGRPSKTAEAARRRERERIAAMTPIERALRALELGERRRYLVELSRRAHDAR